MEDEIKRPIQNCQFGDPDDGCCLYPDKFTPECRIDDCPFYDSDRVFRGEIFLTAASPANDGILYTPMCAFLDKKEAQKHFEACEKYDEMAFHHVLRIQLNPKLDLSAPYNITLAETGGSTR